MTKSCLRICFSATLPTPLYTKTGHGKSSSEATNVFFFFRILPTQEKSFARSLNKQGIKRRNK
jgi:hypothetical protein